MAVRQATIWHNPRCGTSRAVLQLMRDHGVEPLIVNYVSHPPTRAVLKRVARDSGAGVRGLVRAKEPVHAELGLDGADDDTLLDAMLAHPVLINRPVVQTRAGTRLCRPAETVLELLPG